MISEAVVLAMAIDLAAVDGVVGVVLGGSRARGDALPTSDVDLGVYTHGERDTASLNRLADRWSEQPVTIGPAGSWGPWVDSGGWLRVDGTAVDWILRDLERVRSAWARARRGEFAFAPQAGHPLGFLDVAYAGELALGRILADPSDTLTELQRETRDYPPALREAVVGVLWEADFITGSLEKAVARVDTTYVTLCLSRALLLCAHALHAHAGVWVTNEKGLVPGVTRLPLSPKDFSLRAAAALGSAGDDVATLGVAVAAGQDLVAETRALLS